MNDLALYEIYDIVHIPFWQTIGFRIVCGVIAVLLLGILCVVIYGYYVRIKNKKALSWERALSRLTQLKQQPLIVAQDHKIFYFTLTNIMKTYFSDRYSLNVLPKTDAEFVAFISQEKKIATDAITKLDTIFTDVSLVKFANKQAVRDKMIQDIDRGFAIVCETMPHENELEQGTRAT